MENKIKLIIEQLKSMKFHAKAGYRAIVHNWKARCIKGKDYIHHKFY